MLGMDKKIIIEAKAETSKNVKTLITLTKDMQVGNQTINVDPTLLFLRLIAPFETAEDTMECFSYELIPIPTSLFKVNLLKNHS